MNQIALETLKNKIEHRFRVSQGRDYHFPRLPSYYESQYDSPETSLDAITIYDLTSQGKRHRPPPEMSMASSTQFRTTAASDVQKFQVYLKPQQETQNNKQSPAWLKSMLQNRLKTEKLSAQPQYLSQSPPPNINRLKKNVSEYQMNISKSQRSDNSLSSRIIQQSTLTARQKQNTDSVTYKSGITDLREMLMQQQQEQLQAYFLKTPKNSNRQIASRVQPRNQNLQSPRTANIKKISSQHFSNERSKGLQQSISPRFDSSNSQLYYNSNTNASKAITSQANNPYGVSLAIKNFRQKIIRKV